MEVFTSCRSLCTQWCDAALAARDDKSRKSEAVVAAVDNFDLSALSDAAARIENAISWNDTDPQIVEYEDHDVDIYEEDVDWHAGDCDDELDDTAYAAGTLNLEDADASASQVYASASRSFQEARALLARVQECQRLIFLLLVLVLLMAWLSHPLIENPATSRGKGKEGQEERKVLFSEKWKTDKSGYSWHSAKNIELTCRVSSSDVQEASD